MGQPTPEQLQQAGMVELTTWQDIMQAEKNGHQIRSFDSASGKWPPVVRAFVTDNWRTPVVTPPPPPPVTHTVTFNSEGGSPVVSPYTVTADVTLDAQWTAVVVTPPPGQYPLGIAPPPLAPGESVLFFNNMDTPDNGDLAVYDGTSQPSSGRFWKGNVAYEGGLLKLKMNQNPSVGTPANNNWIGGGVQLVTHTVFAGQRVEWAYQDTPLPGVFQIGLLFASNNVWPSGGDIDIDEAGDGQPFKSTIIWADANGNKQQMQFSAPPSGTTPHYSGIEWTNGGELVFYADGAEYAREPVPPAPFGSAGLNFCLQTQQEYVITNNGGEAVEAVDWLRVVKLAA